VEVLGLSAYDAGVLTAERALADWFEGVLAGPKGPRDAKTAATWVTGELLRHVNERGTPLASLRVTPAALGELIDLVAAGTINVRTAKEVLREVLETGGSPAALVAERGMAQVSDAGATEEACRKAIEAEPAAAADVRAGKEKAFGRLLGAAMKALGGRGNPALVRETLRRVLGVPS
jgi:aspartyl-tRNA(Asn)/glutamyl-tRNA(Gln) amidotransferase subunit B